MRIGKDLRHGILENFHRTFRWISNDFQMRASKCIPDMNLYSDCIMKSGTGSAVWRSIWPSIVSGVSPSSNQGSWFRVSLMNFGKSPRFCDRFTIIRLESPRISFVRISGCFPGEFREIPSVFLVNFTANRKKRLGDSREFVRKVPKHADKRYPDFDVGNSPSSLCARSLSILSYSIHIYCTCRWR